MRRVMRRGRLATTLNFAVMRRSIIEVFVANDAPYFMQ